MIDPEWPRCRHWIEAALEYAYGTHTIEDVEAGIASKMMQFWPGRRSAMVTELLVYPRLKALNFFLVGGDLRELLDELEPRVIAWAKAEGCSRVSQVGRSGWQRVLREKGYRSGLSVTFKDL